MKPIAPAIATPLPTHRAVPIMSMARNLPSETPNETAVSSPRLKVFKSGPIRVSIIIPIIVSGAHINKSTN